MTEDFPAERAELAVLVHADDLVIWRSLTKPVGRDGNLES
jgi:hypothetical protein